MSVLDAYNERNALYVLIKFIDAHEYALDKLQFLLGIYSGGGGRSGGEGQGRCEQRTSSFSAAVDAAYASGSSVSGNSPKPRQAPTLHTSRALRCIRLSWKRMRW